ncbi:IGHMBP2 family helicase [Flavipsychrobacter stenotrophus]|uniref:IGHMBP2 family helicase n=1 Tax=Flavipsychrobacter stenotrophus TaxID=2077091 RepID=A0A2S7SSP4_9BACT|nr:AAA domain-containing protein [Flavipsychrobacter stenotrophus]PQJ09728.1 IGHMBP2 family helicase [Flavipsychrobacter stenotrophus]
MDYFKNLLNLLKLEREEDRNAYKQLTERSSVAERRANGLSWYPIAIRGTELGRGDYLTVEVERTTHNDVSHQLRFGASAVLFSNHEPKEHRIEGTITYQGGNKLKISLRTDELPDWADDGKLGIDLLFDDNSYEEMNNALKLATTLAEKKDEGRLINILTGQAKPTFDDTLTPVINTRLNTIQQVAVNKIIQANELAIVHGPPGTGKTTTLVQAIKELIAHDHKQILVVAPSNAAVDLLSEKLAEEGLNVLRVGNPARVSERLMALTLDSKMGEHSANKEIKKLKQRASEFKNMAHKYKRSFGKAEREQRKALFDEARKIMKDVGNTEQYIIDDIVAKAQVITATLVGANHYTVRDIRYHTVVIDEAGQALEPACWIPILKAKKVVLAGDHCQLPPTIKSNEAAKQGLANTLLEKCVALHPESVILLQEQYRMNESIMGYSSKVFYDNKLIAHGSVATHLLHDADAPLAFVDTAGCGFDEKTEGTSTSNPEEATLLFKHLEKLITELQPHFTPDTFPTIGIISPYRQQILALQDLYQHATFLQPYRSKITINTIDSFQGQERDIMYISMVRSNTDNIIGFLSDIRRMNVAMTRARKKLVIIGDSGTLSRLPFYSDFISYAESLNAYQSAWEFMDV